MFNNKLDNMKTKNKVFILLICICCIYTTLNCQKPILGLAENFTFLTSNGAFENSGASTIIGNIGTNTGSFIGFPPGTLTGYIHINDGVSNQASIDMNSTYIDLFSRTCSTVLGTTLGNGQIITPGIYCIGGASVLNGNLILDGQNDPNSIFIFQMNNAFSTNSLSTISLINNASYENIFWQVNGAVELGTNSIFNGVIIANGAINLLDFTTLNGKGLSINGAINLHNVNAKRTDSPIPLSIQILSFDIKNGNNRPTISWITSSEVNNDYFELESSLNGDEWKEIENIKGAGNSSKLKHYSSIISNPPLGISYYRLKQIDFDGKISYSDVISNEFKYPIDNEVFPNPTTGIIHFTNETTDYIYISSVNGDIIRVVQTEDNTVDLSDEKNGCYFINSTNSLNTINYKLILTSPK